MLSPLATVVYKHFEEITDPRLNRGLNHDLGELMFIALTAALANADSWADVERFGTSHQDWFAKHLPLENGIPSHDTFSRVFARLDSGEFLTAMHRWIDDFSDSLRGQGIAIDGKTLRGSHDVRHGQSPLHTITAFACGTRTVLRQMSVPDKSNEIPAVPLLLQMLDLVDATVTLDAMHCQPETLKAVLDRGGDYIVTVKRNQPSLHEYLQDRFEGCAERDFEEEGLRKLVTLDKGHGRKERRSYYVLGASKKEADVLSRWPGLRSIGMVIRQRWVKGVEQTEVALFVSSREPKVRETARLLRGHWGIENSQHYVLDVVFAEDASRIRKGSGPEVTAGIRRLALNILQRDTTVRDNLRGKRLRAGWDETVLDRIYAAFSMN